MGFNYYNHGNIRRCRIANGQLQVQDNYGRIKTYKTPCLYQTDWQQNLFLNSYIAFYLTDASGREIIGRFDSTISVYQGDLLVGLSSWECPPEPDFITVGYFTQREFSDDILLDVTAPDTVYRREARVEAKLDKPLVGEPNLQMGLAVSHQHPGYSVICLKGGASVAIPVWNVQDRLRVGACRSFV